MWAIDGALLLVRCRFGSLTPPDWDERGGGRAAASHVIRFRCTSMDRSLGCRLGRFWKLKNVPLTSTDVQGTLITGSSLSFSSSSTSASIVPTPTTLDAEALVTRSSTPFGGSGCRSKPSPSAGAGSVNGNESSCILGSGSATMSRAVTPPDPGSCTSWKRATSCQSRHLHCVRGTA